MEQRLLARRLNKGSVPAGEAAASARDAASDCEAASLNNIREAVPAGVAARVSQTTGLLWKSHCHTGP